VPITPFHFGVGAALHAVDPRRVSFLSFCVANCITDCEPIYYIFRGEHPPHRFLHTFLGATLVAAATLGLFLWARRLAGKWELPNPFGWRSLSVQAVAIGALLGTYSHILLDGIMHPDVRPFAPWNDLNPFYALISVGWLHLACLLAGAFGIGVIALRDRWRQ
jgi:membrane-bound metal-dependent hydrolase YbcI (DUF457 family)